VELEGIEAFARNVMGFVFSFVVIQEVVSGSLDGVGIVGHMTYRLFLALE
jgi:hypothetical protein